MKKTLLTGLALCLGIGAAQAQLSGSYTVGGATPDYATIQEAADDLAASGVNGPVIINIRDGVYNENVTQAHIPGVSSTNSVTYQSESADSSLVKIQVASGNTFYSDSADYLRFKDLGFITSGIEYGVVISKITDVEFDGCNFYTPSTTALRVGAGNMVMNSFMMSDSRFVGDYGVEVDSILNLTSFVLEDTWMDIYYTAFTVDVIQDAMSVTVQNDSIWSSDEDGFAIRTGGNIYGTTANDMYVDVTGNGLIFEAQYNNYPVTLNNIEVMNNQSDGIRVEGYDGVVQDVTATNITIDGQGYGINIYSDQAVSNVHVADVRSEATDGRALNIRGYYTGVQNVLIEDSYFFGGMYNQAVNIESDENVENVTVVRDSMLCESSTALDIEADELLSNVLIEDVYCYADTTDSNGGTAMRLEADDYKMEHIELLNTTCLGNSGVRFDEQNGAIDVTIDNCDFTGTYSDAFYIYARTERVGDWYVTNSNFTSVNDGDGCEIYGSDAFFDNLNFYNCVFDAMYTALDLDSDDNVQNCTVRNCTMISNDGRCLDVEAYDGGVYSFVLDSCDMTRISEGTVCEIESNYLNGDSLWVTNNSIVCLDINSNTWGRGLDLEADYGDWSNVWIQNNQIRAYTGIEFETDYGNAINAWIEDNTIEAYYYGLDLDGGGVDYHIQNNTISGVNDTLQTGIYAYAYDGNSDGYYIENNTIDDVANRGLDIQYGENLFVHDNQVRMGVTDPMNSTSYGLYVRRLNQAAVFSRNTFYADSANHAAYFDNCSFTTTGGVLENNFFAGFESGLRLSDVNGLNVYHNSFSTDENVVGVYLSQVGDVDIQNNIFSMNNGALGNMYEIISPVVNTTIDYNAFEFDETSNDFAIGDVVYATLADWQAATGYDANSIFATPAFVDAYADLHLDCASTALNVGNTGLSVEDIDGNARLSSPTIGADQILSAGSVFAMDTAYMCDQGVVLDAGTSSGMVSYQWSTGETTQQITVYTPNVYTVDVTDACGTNTDGIVVAYSTVTTAAAAGTQSFLTTIFTNTSSNANSYFWDFGDGNTSTDEEPAHTYAIDGTFTVTLIAYGDCMNDTTTFDVTPNTVGLNELAEVNVGVYPNPSNGELNILMNGTDNAQVSVLDLSGKVIRTEQMIEGVLTMDMTNVPSGVYFINVMSEGTNIATTRWVKH